MGFIQQDASKLMILSYTGMILGYLNKGVLFLIVLSSEQIGLLNLLVGVAVLFAQLASMGSFYSLQKFTPFLRNRNETNFKFLKFNSKLAIFGFLATTVLVLLFNDYIITFYQEKSKLFIDYFLWIIPLGLAHLIYLFFDQHLRIIYKNQVSVISFEVILRMLITILLLTKIFFPSITFFEFSISYFLIYFIPGIILILYSYKLGEFKKNENDKSVSKKLRKIILSYSLFNQVNSIGRIVVFTVDAMMIASMIDLSRTGVYTTVIFITSALQVPYKSIFRSSTPLVSEYWKTKNLTKMNELYKKTSSVSLLISLYMFLGVWINRDEIFSLFPTEFQGIAMLFLFLMSGKLVDMYFGINSLILITSKKYKLDFVFTLVLIILVVGLNLLLIPIYGIEGAAISTSIALIFFNLLRMIFVYYHFKLSLFEIKQIYIIVIALISCILLQDLQIFDNVFLEISISGALLTILYFGSIYLFKVQDETNNFIKKIVLLGLNKVKLIK